MVKLFMDELDPFNLFTKYVPAAAGSLAAHAESLCILTPNIICDNKPLYKVQEWLSKYCDGFVADQDAASLFNDDVTHVPNWNGLRTLLEKEDFIYVADCKLCSHNNLSHISENGARFITIVPKDRKQFKQFLSYLKTNDVPWKDALSIESSRKKGKMNIYKTYEGEPTKEGFRIVFIHS